MSIIHVAFYPSDWLAGTRGLSAEETGVYITLVARMYEMAAPIERDDQRLARLCGCKTKPAFVKALDYLISEGKISDTKDGLFNERVQKEIKNTTEKSDKAKAAAQSRWDRKPNKNNEGCDANAMRAHMPGVCQSESESYYDSTDVLSLHANVPNPEKPKPKKPPAKRAVAIPEGWLPSQKNIDDAKERDFSDEEIQNETHQFRDYHLARGSTFKNWDAAWRTWLGNSRKFGRNRSMAGGPPARGHGQGGGIAGAVARRRASGQN